MGPSAERTLTARRGALLESVKEYCGVSPLRAQLAARNLTLIVVIPPEK